MHTTEVFQQAPEVEATDQVLDEEWDCWIEGGWAQF